MEQPGRTAGPHQALALAARWLGRESPAGARSAYVAGSSLALTLFLLATPLAADGVRLNADTAWAFASAWAVVGGCVHLLHAALTLVPPWRRWADLRLTLAAGGTFAFCLVLRLHYTWFGAHLMTADALEMAVDGVRDRKSVV